MTRYLLLGLLLFRRAFDGFAGLFIDFLNICRLTFHLTGHFDVDDLIFEINLNNVGSGERVPITLRADEPASQVLG